MDESELPRTSKLLGSIISLRSEKKPIPIVITDSTAKIFADEKDLSIDPSFAKFEVPYEIKCRMRYEQKRQKYERQFQKELKLLEHFQPSAYDAARFNRHLCITTLWPPLHNRREIDYVHYNFFCLTLKQKKRLNYLLRAPQH